MRFASFGKKNFFFFGLRNKSEYFFCLFITHNIIKAGGQSIKNRLETFYLRRSVERKIEKKQI